MKTNCIGVSLWLIVAVSPSFSQENIDLRSTPKETGPVIYCEGVVRKPPRAKVQVSILNPINGSYAVGEKVPVDIEIRNTGDRALLIPMQPRSDKLFIDNEKFPVTLLEMCIHVDGDETYAERCLSSRGTKPDSLLPLQPDHSVIMQDTFEIALLKPEAFALAMQGGYTMSFSTYVSFSLVTVTSYPRRLYNDCISPIGDSERSNLTSLTITVLQKKN